jgi:hypothetical protein
MYLIKMLDLIANPDALLAAMLATYAIPIGTVWREYTKCHATSVSQIICKNKCIVIGSMALMAIATCMYEHQRMKRAPKECKHLHNIGFACIVLLLACIFSLVSIDEIHFAHSAFAVMGFAAIVGFTWVHACFIQTPACAGVIAMQFASCAHITHRSSQNGDIFWGEVAFIGAFAVFYLYLHWEYNHDRMPDSAAICSSVSDAGNAMENRILSAPVSS